MRTRAAASGLRNLRCLRKGRSRPNIVRQQRLDGAGLAFGANQGARRARQRSASRELCVRAHFYFGRASRRLQRLSTAGRVNRVPLRQREWDRANGNEQNQVKSASDKMRFNSWG